MGLRIDDPSFLVRGPRPKQPTPSRAKPPKPLPKKRAEPRRTDAGVVTGGQKLIPIVTDPQYVADMHADACWLTGLKGTPSDPIVVAHIGNPGKGLKNDAESLAMLDSLHRAWHQKGNVVILAHLENNPNLLLALIRAFAREQYFSGRSESSPSLRDEGKEGVR